MVEPFLGSLTTSPNMFPSILPRVLRTANESGAGSVQVIRRHSTGGRRDQAAGAPRRFSLRDSDRAGRLGRLAGLRHRFDRDRADAAACRGVQPLGEHSSGVAPRAGGIPFRARQGLGIGCSPGFSQPDSCESESKAITEAASHDGRDGTALTPPMHAERHEADALLHTWDAAGGDPARARPPPCRLSRRAACRSRAGSSDR